MNASLRDRLKIFFARTNVYLMLMKIASFPSTVIVSLIIVRGQSYFFRAQFFSGRNVLINVS